MHSGWCCLLKTDVRVGDEESAKNGVHDRVEGAGGEGSNAERDQTDTDSTGDRDVR